MRELVDADIRNSMGTIADRTDRTDLWVRGKRQAESKMRQWKGHICQRCNAHLPSSSACRSDRSARQSVLRLLVRRAL